MNTDNQPNPDDGYRNAWKQVFDEAAEAPPPRVWNAIERQLNTDDRARIVPLWWGQVRPWATGMAATVAVVLMGWWAWQKLTPTVPTAQQAVNEPGVLVAGKLKPEQRIEKPDQGIEGTAPATTRSDIISNKPASTRNPGGGSLLPSSSIASRISRIEPASQPDPLAHDVPPERRVSSNIAVTGFVHRTDLTPDTPAPAVFGETSAMISGVEPGPINEGERVDLSVDELSGKPFRSRQPGIQRIVWFRNEEPNAVVPEQSKSDERETWVSLSAMPSSFNPAVAAYLPPTPTLSSYNLIATSYALPKASSMLRNEAGVGVAVQAGAGTQLNARWSVEAGIGYLQAHSTVVSPAQGIPGISNDNLTGNPGLTLYTAVVQSNIHPNSSSASLTGNSSYDRSTYIPTNLYSSQTEGRTSNDYSFVQLPVQVGYQLRPRRKLGLSLLGGLLTNWFVRNTVGETLVVKPSDNVYRSLTLAGTTGVRFRYRSSRRWSASLAGVYQQSLQFGTRSDASLQTRPHTVGVSFGMDYHF